MTLAESDLKRIADHVFNFGTLGDRFIGADALLIWQYVRFNPAYQKDYATLSSQLQSESVDEDFATQIFCEEWCMSEPLDYETPIPPKRFYFNRRLVKRFSNLKKLRLQMEWDSDYSPILLTINPKGDRELILRQVAALLKENESSKVKTRRIKGSNISHLADNFICFYLSRHLNLRNRDVKLAYEKIGTGGTLQDHQIRKKVASFEERSLAAPWCFFIAPTQ